MEPKYYVPEYSDIYIGQDLYTIDGYKIDLSTIDSLTWFLTSNNCYRDGENNITYGISLENYRLKYLDTSDIESIIHENAKDYHTIFKLRSSYEDELVFQTYWVEENEFLDEEYIYWDIKYNQIKITHKSKTLFWGKIKNRSEFKKVLNMLDIK